MIFVVGAFGFVVGIICGMMSMTHMVDNNED